MQNSHRQINIFLFLLLFCLNLKAQTDFSFENISKIGLPVISINTLNGEEPTCDYITHPEGSMGESITNSTKVPCRIIITKNQEVLFDSGEYEKNVSGATIKINGNTSAYNDNKPYKIKLQVKEDLLLRGNKKYKDKEWRLLKDARTLNTMIGLKMNELIGMPWTPSYMPCNVFINNDYRGCYLLIESVKRNSDSRLNVDENTGFIVERDPYWWNESIYFSTDYFNMSNGYRWTWKYPDEDDVTEEITEYVQSSINRAEKSIKEGNYEQYIDVNSFVSWILAHDILGTWDSGGSNLYLMRYDNNSLLQMANMWDFDTIFWMNKDSFSRYHTESYDYYFPLLFNNVNTTFLYAYINKWNKIKDIIPQQIIDFIKEFADSEEGKALQLSREYYTKRWNKELTTVSEDVEKVTDWFNNHLPWLDTTINNMSKPTGISTTYLNQNAHSSPIFDIHGKQMNTLQKGINIINGKKILIK
jgi:hypothetical protein